MKIIKSGLGKKKEFVGLYRINCKKCDCLFEASEREAIRRETERRPGGVDKLDFMCPQCLFITKLFADEWHSKVEVVPQEVLDKIESITNLNKKQVEELGKISREIDPNTVTEITWTELLSRKFDGGVK